jgi:hypothetical protein
LKIPILLTAAVAMAGLGTTVSREKPLGLSMGMSESALQRVPGATLEHAPVRNTFVLRLATKPDRRFDTFILVVDPHYGLCRFGARGPELPANKIKEAFSAVRSDLDRIYGGTAATRPSPLPADPGRLSATWSAASNATMGKTVQSLRLVAWTNGSDYFLLLEGGFINNNNNQCN